MNNQEIKKSTLTQSRLKELFTYNPYTGVLTKNNLTVNSKYKASSKKYTPNAHGYIVIHISGKRYPLHRLAFLYMCGEFPESVVDHINGDKLDNRWVNLKSTSICENNRNKPIRSDNKSGVNGVTFHKETKKWQATIRVNGVTKYLGIHKLKSDAVEARKQADEMYGFSKYHGRPLNSESVYKRADKALKEQNNGK